MPGYAVGVRDADYTILEREAQRKRCSTRELIKESFNRNIGKLRGGIGTRRRR